MHNQALGQNMTRVEAEALINEIDQGQEVRA
jgi:hypothetical protein